MTTNNSWNSSVPIQVALGGTGNSTLTAHSVLVGEGTSPINAIGPGTQYQVLQSGGAASDPAYSTATYPNATSAAKILLCNTTNQVIAHNVLNGNFTYEKSVAGAETLLIVSNTDNTDGGSSATLRASVGGASGGDAYFEAAISGGNSWTWGLDNSDSDAFAISSGSALGTNNVMRIATSGEINYPLQPAFSSYLSANADNVTGDNTVYQIVFDTEIFDQNTDYNTGTGNFTAPVTGRYYLEASITYTGIGALHTFGTMFITTSNRSYNPCSINPYAAVSSTGYTGINSAVIADMDAGDTAYIAAVSSGGAKTVDIYGAATLDTHFCGYLSC